MRKLILLKTILLIMISGCGEENFKKFSKLGELRVVGIVSDVPEVDGTNTGNVNVTLTPYISDIEAAGRTFSVTVVTCLDTGVTRGGSPECLSPTTQTYPNGNTFNTAGLAANNYTGAMDPITVTIANPSSLISAFSAQQRFNGVNFLVAFRLQSGSTITNAIKAIPISERTTLNSNPVIEGVTYNGAAITSGLNSGGALDMTFTNGAQSYEVMRADGSIITKQESLLISWFVSKGKIQPPRMIDSQNTTFFPENTSAVTLIGVARDRRGGTAVRILNP